MLNTQQLSELLDINDQQEAQQQHSVLQERIKMHQDKVFEEYVQQAIRVRLVQQLLQLLHVLQENTVQQDHQQKQVALQELIILIKRKNQLLIV